MIRTHRQILALFLFISMGVAACGRGEGKTDAKGQVVSRGFQIVGDEDWDDLANHRPPLDPLFPQGYENARAVGQLEVAGLRCSAFLVARNLVMTASHCVSDENGNLLSLAGALVRFGREFDPVSGEMPKEHVFPVSNEIIAIDFAHDLAVLKTEKTSFDEQPGDYWPIVSLQATDPGLDQSLYIPSMNCRTDDANCTPRLLFAPGFAGDTGVARASKCVITDTSLSTQWANQYSDGYGTNCDTNPGSSGAPVFDASTNRVIGIVSRGNTWIAIATSIPRYIQEHDANQNGVADFLEGTRTVNYFDLSGDGIDDSMMRYQTDVTHTLYTRLGNAFREDAVLPLMNFPFEAGLVGAVDVLRYQASVAPGTYETVQALASALEVALNSAQPAPGGSPSGPTFSAAGGHARVEVKNDYIEIRFENVTEVRLDYRPGWMRETGLLTTLSPSSGQWIRKPSPNGSPAVSEVVYRASRQAALRMPDDNTQLKSPFIAQDDPFCTGPGDELFFGRFVAGKGVKRLCHSTNGAFAIQDDTRTQWGWPGVIFDTIWQSPQAWCPASEGVFGTGDFDGDGVLDLFCKRPYEIEISYSDRNATSSADAFLAPAFTHVHPFYWCSFGNPTIYVSDFNMDGKADLLCVPHPGAHSVYLNTAASQTDSPFTGNDWESTTIGWCHTGRLFLGDFDMVPGKDLLCEDNGSWTIARNRFVERGEFVYPASARVTGAPWCNTPTAVMQAVKLNKDAITDFVCDDAMGNHWEKDGWTFLYPPREEIKIDLCDTTIAATPFCTKAGNSICNEAWAASLPQCQGLVKLNFRPNEPAKAMCPPHCPSGLSMLKSAVDQDENLISLVQLAVDEESSVGGIRVLKTNNKNEALWKSQPISSLDGLVSARAVSLDSAGNVYVLGDGTGRFAPEEDASALSRDVFVQKLSGVDGSTLWRRKIGADPVLSPTATPNDFGADLFVDESGPEPRVYVVGDTEGSFPGTPEFPNLHAGGRDLFVARLSSGGELELVRQFGGVGDDVASSLTHGTWVNGEGDLYVAGYTDSRVEDGSGPESITQTIHRGGLDAFLVHLTTLIPDAGRGSNVEGYPVVSHAYQWGTAGDEWATAATTTWDQVPGSVYVAGSTTGDLFGNSATMAGWVLKAGNLAVGATNLETDTGVPDYYWHVLLGTTSSEYATAIALRSYQDDVFVTQITDDTGLSVRHIDASNGLLETSYSSLPMCTGAGPTPKGVELPSSPHTLPVAAFSTAMCSDEEQYASWVESL